MIHEWMTKAALDAKELAVVPIHVTIARDNTYQVAATRAQRHLTAVRAVSAGRNCLRQFPWSMLMTISSIKQGACRADLDAVAALRAIQPAAERADNRVRAAIAGFDRFFAHPFVADARATLAENATLRIVGDHRRKIFLSSRILAFNKALFQIAPIESQLLQFALAAPITDGAIQRVIREQELEHRSLGLLDL